MSDAQLEILLTRALDAPFKKSLCKFNVYEQSLSEVFGQLDPLWQDGELVIDLKITPPKEPP